MKFFKRPHEEEFAQTVEEWTTHRQAIMQASYGLYMDLLEQHRDLCNDACSAVTSVSQLSCVAKGKY